MSQRRRERPLAEIAGTRRRAVRVAGFPAPLRPILDLVGRRAAVLHAALDCRVVEALVAVAATLSGDVVLVTPLPGRARRFAVKVLPDARHVTREGGVRGYEADGVRLWIVPSWSELRDLPISVASHLVVEGAHRCEENPERLVATAAGASVWMTGEPGVRGSWWDALRREPDVALVRVPAADVVAAFPDQAARMLAPEAPGYARLMALQDDVDVEVDGARVADHPARVFLRTRLKVRSDKGADFLSPSQAREAEAMLGPGWQSGQDGVPIVTFQLTALQKRYLAIKRHARRLGYNKFLLLKHRRLGCTTLEQGLSYRLCVSAPHVEVATLAHTAESTDRIFRMVTLFHERDPLAPRRVSDSQRRLDLENGSHFFTGTAGGQGVFRGDTVQKVHLSEVAKFGRGANRVANVDDLLAGAIGAASRGEVVAETTPNGVEWFALKYRGAMKNRDVRPGAGDNDWWPIFLAWFMDRANRAAPGEYDPDEIRDTLTDQERRLQERFGLDLAQLAWRRRQVMTYGNLFLQEYPEDEDTCFFMSGHPYFDADHAKTLLDALPDDSQTEHPLYGVRRSVPGGTVITWEDPIPGEEYVLGVDTSEGLPWSDYGGIGVIRVRTCAQVCSIHGRFPPPQLAALTIETALRYNRGLTGVERNNHGHAVLQEIVRNGHGRSHVLGGWLFHHADDQNPPASRPVERNPITVARPGWVTSPATRPMMLSTMRRLLLSTPGLVVRDRTFARELLTFRLQGDGQYSADAGARDDSITKWSIAVQMLEQPRGHGGID